MNKVSYNKVRHHYWPYLILGCCLLLGSSLHAQHTVTGKVSDNGSVLPGVTVATTQFNVSTITDENGVYSLQAKPADTLVFSYVGYATQKRAVGNATRIDVVLGMDTGELAEVVVNAGYYKVKDKERTGSIARIAAKDIELQPVNNPLAAMQGRMAGVAITQSTGTAGGGFDIQIRGINSLRAEGNMPLYLVNGVPYSGQSLGDVQASGAILAGASSPLNSINPADIESIEVLKDADATAIYGSRGANGVVLITTKKGKSGKAQFALQSATGVAKVGRRMRMMDTPTYVSMREEAYANDGFTALPPDAYDINGTWDRNRYTDWRDALIGGTAHYNSLQASLSGGSASTHYRLGGTYRKETTVFPGSDYYAKYAFQSTINHASEDRRFHLDLSVNYAQDYNSIQANDLSTRAYQLAPNAPALYKEDGSLNWEGGTFENPLAQSQSQYRNTTTSWIANAVLRYELLPQLEIKANLGYNDIRLSEDKTLPSTLYNPSYGVTSANSMLVLNEGTRHSWIVEPQIGYANQWGEHRINALAGTTFQSEESERTSYLGQGFTHNQLIHNLGAARTVQVRANPNAAYRYQALYARLNYIFKDRYILNLTGRRDGSSRFGPSERYANFGAIGAAWLFVQEPFMENQRNWLSSGKLRGSYGTTGSDQIGDYQYLDTYSLGTLPYDGTNGLQPTRLFNPNFGWEVNRKLEVALELGFFKERLSLTTAYYRNRSSNQLVGIPLPATTGFPSIQANLDATIENTGLEVEVQATLFKGSSFGWTTQFNISLPENKLIRFEGLEGSTYANRYVVGASVNVLKNYHYTGIDPNSGTYQFEDYNGDGQLSAPDDRQYLNDLSQEWFGGVGNQLRYKNWDLDFLFQFVKQQGYNYKYAMGFAGVQTNLPEYAANHWPSGGTGAEIQQYGVGYNNDAVDAYYRFIGSNAVISDASYVRLKSLSLAYKLPAPKNSSLSAKVYLQGQNLWTLTKYKGVDPENQSISYLPPLRQYTLGMQLNF